MLVGNFETLGSKFRNCSVLYVPHHPDVWILVTMKPVISIIMGSRSDWATMQTAEVLDRFGVAYEKKLSLPTGRRPHVQTRRRGT